MGAGGRSDRPGGFIGTALWRKLAVKAARARAPGRGPCVRTHTRLSRRDTTAPTHTHTDTRHTATHARASHTDATPTHTRVTTPSHWTLQTKTPDPSQYCYCVLAGVVRPSDRGIYHRRGPPKCRRNDAKYIIVLLLRFIQHRNGQAATLPREVYQNCDAHGLCSIQRLSAVGLCVESIAEAAVSSQAAARAHDAARQTVTRLSGGRCSDGAVQDEVPAIIRDCVVRWSWTQRF